MTTKSSGGKTGGTDVVDVCPSQAHGIGCVYTGAGDLTAFLGEMRGLVATEGHLLSRNMVWGEVTSQLTKRPVTLIFRRDRTGADDGGMSAVADKLLGATVMGAMAATEAAAAMTVDTGSDEEAVAAADAAVGIDPGYVKAHYRKASALAELGREPALVQQ